MNLSMKLRLVGFVLAIAMLASLIVWTALTSFRRVERSRVQLTDAQSESFRIASQFQQALLALNERVLKFVLHHDTNEWIGFEREWEDLNHWIDEQHLSSPVEKQVLDKINDAYD